jgi:hypothetical protein
MADINNLYATIEVKQGILYKLIDYKPFRILFGLLPYRWIIWFAVKNIKYKVGKNKWQGFKMEIV